MLSPSGSEQQGYPKETARNRGQHLPPLRWLRRQKHVRMHGHHVEKSERSRLLEIAADEVEETEVLELEMDRKQVRLEVEVEGWRSGLVLAVQAPTDTRWLEW
jgi:hypothetical protein